MSKRLIVNADDCNLTAGVTSAILDCHDHGILSSTTWMANLPAKPGDVRKILARKKLGVGIHLNLTMGAPVLNPVKISSLVSEEGRFRRVQQQLSKLPAAADVCAEYKAQIERFSKIFGRRPTHLDTHHQVHDHPFFLTVLIQTADFFDLPIRRSKLFDDKISFDFHAQSPDSVLGDLNPAGYWRREALLGTLQALKEGTHEIMCHPGKVDQDLKALSSFTHGRDDEWRLFRQGGLRAVLTRLGIELTHYGLCYTF